ERERVEASGQCLHRLAESVTRCPVVEGVLHHGLAQQMTEQGYPGQQMPTLVTGPPDEQVALGHKRSSARWKLDAAHRSNLGRLPISVVSSSPDDVIEAFSNAFDLLHRGAPDAARCAPRICTICTHDRFDGAGGTLERRGSRPAPAGLSPVADMLE